MTIQWLWIFTFPRSNQKTNRPVILCVGTPRSVRTVATVWTASVSAEVSSKPFVVVKLDRSKEKKGRERWVVLSSHRSEVFYYGMFVEPRKHHYFHALGLIKAGSKNVPNLLLQRH